MGRSDDSISRRRNRKCRKKQEDKKDSSSKVSARVAAIIAIKNRRKSGKRRLCQGMCFSLPTPEDPFNDKHDKIDNTKKRKRSSKASERPAKKSMVEKVSQCRDDSHIDSRHHEVLEHENVVSGLSGSVEPFSFMRPEIAINLGKPTCGIINRNGLNHSWEESHFESKTQCPSKFLITCLNSIQNGLEHGEDYVTEGDKPFFSHKWGIEFWNCYSSKRDVLEIDRASSTSEQIAWIASTAADAISVKEKEGLSFTSPFLLYIVPSREKASKVREVCKPLKSLGIHTVSLHSGTSIDHQINGLNSCEPEFIVSTPERLLELLTLKVFDTSGVSLLVIDGLEYPFKGTCIDAIKSIRQLISGNPLNVVFCDCSNNSSTSVVQKLPKEPFCR